jgi:hypothetical protein
MESDKKCLDPKDVGCRIGREALLPKFFRKSTLIRDRGGGNKPVIPLHLFQTDRTLKVSRNQARAWGAGLQYIFYDDCASYKYLMESWGVRYANAFATLAPTAIRVSVLSEEAK